MSVATELTKLNTNIKNAYDEIATKGGTIPQNKNTDNLATAISSISGGASIDDYFVTSGNITSYQTMLKKVPDFSTTATRVGFNYCSNLIEVGNITGPNINNTSDMFRNCTSLETAPYFDMSNITNMENMYNTCSNLKNVPVYDWSSITSGNYAFNYCPLLTDQSIDNLLQSCLSATSYTGSKNLRVFPGFASSITMARIMACSHYQACVNAGWTLPY